MHRISSIDELVQPFIIGLATLEVSAEKKFVTATYQCHNL